VHRHCTALHCTAGREREHDEQTPPEIAKEQTNANALKTAGGWQQFRRQFEMNGSTRKTLKPMTYWYRFYVHIISHMIKIKT
jgi:hypothetical protein